MHKIVLDHIFPNYFIPKNAEQSEIWKHHNAFEAGNSYLIVAPSGSGKSTLATAMLGMHFHYEGAIKYDEQVLNTLDLEQIVARRKTDVGLLFQDVRLIKDLTFKENILLRTFKKDKKDFLPQLEEYAQKLGIEKLLDKKAKNCSYGERQRCAIVRSLINPTSFLIYDECFSHLDLVNKKIALELITTVAQQNNSGIIFFELNEFPFDHEHKILHL